MLFLGGGFRCITNPKVRPNDAIVVLYDAKMLQKDAKFVRNDAILRQFETTDFADFKFKNTGTQDSRIWRFFAALRMAKKSGWLL